MKQPQKVLVEAISDTIFENSEPIFTEFNSIGIPSSSTQNLLISPSVISHQVNVKNIILS